MYDDDPLEIANKFRKSAKPNANGQHNGPRPLTDAEIAEMNRRKSSKNADRTNEPSEFPESVLCSQLTADEKNFEWHWEGYIANRSTTLLYALWKAGKSTLISYLLRSLGDGSGTFCGRTILPSNVLVVTEEPQSRWVRRRDELALGDHLRFLIRPFKAKPSAAQWFRFIEHVVHLVRTHDIHLVIFDTLSSVWPVVDENDAAQVQGCLTPLNAITELAALLLVHHTRKSDGGEATAGRGSGALPAFVDTIIELRRFDSADKTSTKRVLTAYGRWDETPPEVVIELDVAAKEYRDCGDRQADKLRFVKDLIFRILPRQRPGMLYDAIKAEDHWPERPPTKSTILDALEQGTADCLWIRDGAGKKGSPYSYWVQEPGTN